MWRIHHAASPEPRCPCRSAGKSSRPPSPWTSQSTTYRPGWKRTATGGMMYSKQNRVLRGLSVLTVKLSVRRNAKRSSRCTHGPTFHRISDGVVRAGRHSGEAVHRHSVGERHLLQSAAQDRRLTSQAAVPMPEGRRGGGTRRHGQGVRVRQGPVRAVFTRGDQGAGGSWNACGGDL